MSGWIRKGYGRVFVFDEAHVEPVEALIRGIDDYEFTNYAPKSPRLVGVFDPDAPLAYIGKFETPVDVITAKCWAAGYPVWCYTRDGNDNHFDGQLLRDL